MTRQKDHAETLLGLMKAHHQLAINTFITFNVKHVQVDGFYIAVMKQIPYLYMSVPWVGKL